MKNKFSKENKKAGYTLVETLVAVSIFSISILGLLAALSQGLVDTSYAKKKMTAAYLAAEGLEHIRGLRDTHILTDPAQGWSNFRSDLSSCGSSNGCGINTAEPVLDNNFVSQCSGPNACKLYLEDGSYNVTSGTDAGFTRRIRYESLNANEVKISSEVSWSQGSGNYDITFSENLFNWTE